MRLLCFSDVHRDKRQAQRLADMAADADVVIAAGDFASAHRGIGDVIDMLVVVETPTVLVPGNNETEEALREACGGWKAATVLHGGSCEIGGRTFFGLGAGVPATPWDWSFDLTEDEAEERLAACPSGAVLVLHSPPKGHLDGWGLGSEAILRAIERVEPPLAVCGHIHQDGGKEERIGPTLLLNAGPEGRFVEI
ncbi:MAG: metallophosphoesterase family protein [Actinomycetota bacterium]|nr:metallophosphoesterase family protein [Actinomycetota bacterium]